MASSYDVLMHMHVAHYCKTLMMMDVFANIHKTKPFIMFSNQTLHLRMYPLISHQTEDSPVFLYVHYSWIFRE